MYIVCIYIYIYYIYYPPTLIYDIEPFSTCKFYKIGRAETKIFIYNITLYASVRVILYVSERYYHKIIMIVIIYYNL